MSIQTIQKYISVSKYPGKTGEHYYGKFFKHYNVPATYTAIGTDDLKSTISWALDNNISGISVSMPYKIEILSMLDGASDECIEYNTCNTVTVTDGKLFGYNCDFYGMAEVTKNINKSDTITILGNGAMGKMFAKYLSEYNITVCARNAGTWDNRYNNANVIINCTGLGTSTSSSPFTEIPKECNLVIDLAVAENQLRKQCNAVGVKYHSGKEFYKHQFLNQFKVYTGIESEGLIYDRYEKI